MKNQKSKGYVLVSVLVIMMVLVVIMYYFSDALFSELAISRNQKSASQAFHLAEAGVQEAVWRIQNDATTRSTFLNTINGLTSFNHDPALLNDGSYQVTIQNSAKATATITATGFIKMGLKTAQRRISAKVTKATTPPPYEHYGAIFTGGSTGNEDIHIDSQATLNITGSELLDTDNDPMTPPVLTPVASLISARNIEFSHSIVSVVKDLIAKDNYINSSSTVTVGGEIKENDSGVYNMPSVDVSSQDPGSYKSLAQAQHQYFDSNTFNQMLQQQGSLTYTGIVYVAGGTGIMLNKNQSLTVNGMLVSEGSIDIGNPNQTGTLTINHIGEDPSGVIALNKLTIQSGGIVSIKGMVYIGDRFRFEDYLHTAPATRTIIVEGGILARRFEGSGVRTMNIELNRNFINQALQPHPDETPVIITQHWEEEY